MKKYLLVRLFACFIMLPGYQLLQAQDTLPYKSLPPVIITPTNTRVPEKVWEHFQQYFPTAEESRWYELDKKFLVKYMTEDKKNQAVFTKRGKLVYNISYGYEKNLPEGVWKTVKQAYSDYDISRAIKVSLYGRTIWLVNIETAKKMILVRVENDEMEEIDNFNKI